MYGSALEMIEVGKLKMDGLSQEQMKHKYLSDIKGLVEDIVMLNEKFN
jgi:hypothetical protein